ncbi:hypothetical protein L1887_24141 [Cichorium endivia]|nr:hypothetical protein L1887_24141 [Cichorium endivia]
MFRSERVVIVWEMETSSMNNGRGNIYQLISWLKLSVPDDIDEDKLMGELDALEMDMGKEGESEGVPSYLEPDNEPDLNEELNLPQALSGHAVPAGRVNNQALDEFGFPAVPHASLRNALFV